MTIQFDNLHKQFHLCNDSVSYIFKVLRNGHLGQLYFGRRLPLDRDYGYLQDLVHYRPMSAQAYEGEYTFSLEQIKQEYPSYGTTDFREGAVEVAQQDGSRLSDFCYVSHEIVAGKPALSGLPATYAEQPEEAETLLITLQDARTGVELVLSYTIFAEEAAIARSAWFRNNGSQVVRLNRAMSLSLDMPDADFDMVQFSGWWSRERHKLVSHLRPGIQSIGSLRGQSSHTHNPFLILKRPNADENQGEAIGFSMVYSGNFLAQVEVDTFNTARIMLGIHPQGFSWQLKPGEAFQTPEAVMVYSCQGMNGMSQTFHSLYRSRLARGAWRDRVCPILINNWEATYFDFDEDKLVRIASKAKEAGVELFVLDDGWFSTRRDDYHGLGDWWPTEGLLPNGIKGLAERINGMGMKFGLWVELEMVNKDTELYRQHPDWIIHVEGRKSSHGRNQYVLDFSRPEVVDYIHDAIYKVLKDANIDYIKWDMNRSITECGSAGWPAEQQGEIFHRYILGVYDLYERLTSEFPHILFESCASGGGRFDPGMFYYAPQAWTSDDTDGGERIYIQYGTSYGYPLSFMGSHVSITPNHQVFRETSLKLRGDVAYFGTFGYELDLGRLPEEEFQQVKEQIKFMKQYRELIQFGTFYRLLDPFAGNEAAWMVVSPDRKQALVGYYRLMAKTCTPFTLTRLQGLLPEAEYEVLVEGRQAMGSFTGSELMAAGLVTTDESCGEQKTAEKVACGDFYSRLFVLQAK